MQNSNKIETGQSSLDLAAVTNTTLTVVVGAGVIGLVTACRLQQRGHSVLLVDPAGVGAGCSFGNAGHFATEQVFPLADPALLAKLPKMMFDPLGPLAIRPGYFAQALPFFYRFVLQMTKPRRQANTVALKSLLSDAIPAWKRLAQDAQCEKLLNIQGSLLVFEQNDLTQVQQIAASYREQGIALIILSHAELRQQFPGLSENIRYAIWFTEVGHTLSPSVLNQQLFQWFLTMGGQFSAQTLLSIKPQQSALQLQLSTQQLTAKTVVICTGAHSKQLLQPLGYQLPLEAERGYHLMTSPPSMPDIPVASFDRKMIMTPMLHGLRLAGTVEFAGLKAQDNWQRAKLLRQHGEALWPELRGSISQVGPEACWSGLRPTLADSLPVISQSHLPGLWLHFGHQHLGLTLAATSTELLIKLIEGDFSAHQRAYPFRVSRFAS
jgi:glycine/D-amino acid oxidase-like deaminating enzyme